MAVYPPVLQEVLEYLRSRDFRDVADGDYPIGQEGCVAKVQRYTTRPMDECRPETHVRFVDVQYLADGEEYLGWCPMSPDLVETEPYDEARDVTFYRALVPESNVALFPGSFAVLYPMDVHRPCCAIEDDCCVPVVKVVVKIPVELMM